MTIDEKNRDFENMNRNMNEYNPKFVQSYKNEKST